MPRVAFIATCLVDQFHPRVGVAALKLLRRAGCQVEFPPGQTCCGQPFFNMGHWSAARPLARRTIEFLRPYDAAVLPSGSCTAMIRVHYPELFREEPAWLDAALDVGRKTFELTEYLVRVLGRQDAAGRFEGAVTYHESCHLQRVLRVREEPRTLLRAAGCRLVEMEESDACCGFGGAFAVKMGPISGAMLDRKLARIAASGAPIVCAGDVSCLLHIGGGLSRRGSPVRAVHVAEIAAGGLG
jgi:L-lactate dehydrogenase complex protein LldE